MSGLAFDIIGPALLVGFLILATHVPLGAIAVDRGVVMAGLALAQLSGLGSAFADRMWGPAGDWAEYFGGLLMACAAAMLLGWIDGRLGRHREAIVGAVFAVAAALYLAVLPAAGGGSDGIGEFLSGRILWVTPTQLLILSVTSAVVLLAWFFRDRVSERYFFYGGLALVVSSSVHVVGVLLVFASLIVPALATVRVAPPRRLKMAFNVGVAGYLVGLVAVVALAVPAGTAIICSLSVVAILAGAGLTMRDPQAADRHPVTEGSPLHDELQPRSNESTSA